jgi:hypothetical protein
VFPSWEKEKSLLDQYKWEKLSIWAVTNQEEEALSILTDCTKRASGDCISKSFQRKKVK